MWCLSVPAGCCPLKTCMVCPSQVLKVSSDGRDTTFVALGEAFTPGSDTRHFCKPTDVAVDAETGNVFVSDGYCNARILKFSADGRYLTQWGAGTCTGGRTHPSTGNCRCSHACLLVCFERLVGQEAARPVSDPPQPGVPARQEGGVRGRQGERSDPVLHR